MGGATEQMPVFKGTFAIPIPPFLSCTFARKCAHSKFISLFKLPVGLLQLMSNNLLVVENRFLLWGFFTQGFLFQKSTLHLLDFGEFFFFCPF